MTREQRFFWSRWGRLVCLPGVRAAILYLLAVLLANGTATLFMPFPVFGQVAVGTLVFGLTFTLRDRMHARGRPFVYGVIALSALATLGLLLSYSYGWGRWWTRLFVGWPWAAHGYSLLVETGPRVFLASVLALTLAETVNTEIFARLGGHPWLVRSLRSTAISVPTDTLLFNTVAFAGVFPLGLWWSVVFGEIVVKFATAGLYAWWLARSPSLSRRAKANVSV